MESLGQNEFYLGMALIIGFAVCWGMMFFALRGKTEILGILFDGGNLLRMIAVVFIVVSVGYLAIINRLASEAATVFSGVAGYVLGGLSKAKSSNRREEK